MRTPSKGGSYEFIDTKQVPCPLHALWMAQAASTFHLTPFVWAHITMRPPRLNSSISPAVDNAVLLLHMTGANGTVFLSPPFGGVLFVPGGLLDASKYFLILPDAIGHGKSSKPSDGLHAHFPKYEYSDMVAAEHLLVTDGLEVDHLRLILGASMGCMHTWM
jgi:pimeloyl-ACP methyl ester carboxylesterase